jgi:hypothetical protein
MAKNKAKEEENNKTKIKITQAILIQMEKASRLRVVTGFERRLLLDRVGAVEQYSMGAVITVAQFEVIEEMAKRYDLVVRGSLDEEE